MPNISENRKIAFPSSIHNTGSGVEPLSNATSCFDIVTEIRDNHHCENVINLHNCQYTII